MEEKQTSHMFITKVSDVGRARHSVNIYIYVYVINQLNSTGQFGKKMKKSHKSKIKRQRDKD